MNIERRKIIRPRHLNPLEREQLRDFEALAAELLEMLADVHVAPVPDEMRWHQVVQGFREALCEAKE